MQAAFTGTALPRAARAPATRRDVPRCELDVVTKNYPAYRRNKAPVIEFDGSNGFRISMVRVKAFAELDADTEPLLDYSDPGVFVPTKTSPPSAISWPAGDGRGVSMRGTRGSFTQPNLKTYGPFPDFYKVRFCFRATAALVFCIRAPTLPLTPQLLMYAEVLRRLTMAVQPRWRAAFAQRLERALVELLERISKEFFPLAVPSRIAFLSVVFAKRLRTVAPRRQCRCCGGECTHALTCAYTSFRHRRNTLFLQWYLCLL